MWLVFHIAVTTAETHHPLPHCAHIYCLVSLNIQQVLMNASLLPSVTQQQNVMEYWWESSASAARPPTASSDIVDNIRN